MKKLLTLALGAVVLAVFTSGETTLAIPPANTVTLSATQNVASKSGCPVTAWVGFVNPQGQKFPLKDNTVFFVKVSGQGSKPQDGLTDSKGELKRTVPSNTTIRAEIHPPNGTVKSNDLACSEPYKQ